MPVHYLLVLLTLNANGLPSASFASADSQEYCLQRARMIVNLLQGSGVQLLEQRCIESERRFTPYRHVTTSADRISVWLVDIQSDPVLLQPMPDLMACRQQQARLRDSGRQTALCAVSAQHEESRWDRIRDWFQQLFASGSKRISGE